MTFPRSKFGSALELSAWPDVDSALILPERRKRFETLRAALQMYLNGSTPGQIKKIHGVTRQEIFYYLQRCTAEHSDGRPMGYRALVGQAHVKSYQRKKEVINVNSDGYGCAGAFVKLLAEYPKIVRIIRKAVGGRTGRSLKAAGLHVRTIHQAMLQELRDTGVKADEYPFNTTSSGYISLCRYIRNLMNQGDSAVMRARFGDVAIDAQIAGMGQTGWLNAAAPLDLVCYDEQALPFIGILKTYIGDEEVDVPLQRCSLCLIVDEHSSAALGYFISTRRRICAGDMLSAVEHLLRPWTPKELTVDGLKYREGAGFPSGVVDGFLGRRIGLVKMDNDLTHYANSVVGFMVEKTGYAVQYGKVRRWITRITGERVFGEIQKRHFRQLPSTTGSGPADRAVSDPVGKAIRYQIEFHELEEIVEVALANYNATPRAELFNKTPLERLRRHYENNGPGSVIPALSAEFMERPHLPEEVFSCVVRGSAANGRRPYIELDTAHYTNDLLRDSWGMIGKKLTVLVRGDFRTLRAFKENGEEYLPLRVIGHWSMSPHTRSMRTEINRLHREGELKFDQSQDPVAAYNVRLAMKAREKGRKNKITRESNRLLESVRFADEKQFIAQMVAPKTELNAPGNTRGYTPPHSLHKWQQAFSKSPKEPQ
ncbi:hypothetical protein [Polaromonas sp. JS666]|uniref:hypothetical protein n=1 Tax=Polaromonas sp. (strain JS666 / ATCC BAA-500) TaxID=296591 RepID=UPI000888D681|nr:hypothetical protein [Polaromonas sp. JS666]SDM42630.1 hypothetical protein SAMN05720382_101307 [Polaromonas sp. JS666]